MFRWVMRPLSGLLALAYALSFLAMCLGGCLTAGPADHGCCRGEDGLKARGSDEDCCKVVPAVSAKHSEAIATPVQPLPVQGYVVMTKTVAYDPAPAPAAAGPPLILRI